MWNEKKKSEENIYYKTIKRGSFAKERNCTTMIV